MAEQSTQSIAVAAPAADVLAATAGRGGWARGGGEGTGEPQPRAEQSPQSIVVAAPAADVMAVIADFEAYPQWVKAARTVEVLQAGPDGRASRVRFVIDATVLTDEYVLDYSWDGDRQVSWTLVQSRIMKSQEGSSTLAGPDAGAADN